jgi:hypothetical protein
VSDDPSTAQDPEIPDSPPTGPEDPSPEIPDDPLGVPAEADPDEVSLPGLPEAEPPADA